MVLSRSAKAEIKSIEGNDALREAFLVLAEHFETGRAVLSFAAEVYGPLVEDDGEAELLQIDAYAEAVGEPPPAVAAGFLSERDIVLIAAKPKMCKSFLAIQVMDDIARGQAVMGEFAVEKPGAVIYLGMEDNPQEIKRRMARRGMLGEGLPVYALRKKINLGTEDGVARLKTLIAGLNLPEPPVAVCVDTARVGLGIDDWNNPGEVTRKVLPLVQFARENCLVILVAHNRKADGEGGDRISGSNALQSNVDGYLLITSKRTDPDGNAVLEMEIENRSEPARKLTAIMDTHTTHVRVLRPEEAEQEARKKRMAEREEWYRKIAVYLSSAGESAIKVVAGVLEQKYDFIYDLVREMVAAGDVTKTDKTIRIDGAGRPAPLFVLSKQGADTYLLEAKTIGMESQQITNEFFAGLQGGEE